jgi:hypothetical protein
MPTRYTTQQSFIPFAVMTDAPPASIYCSSITRASFILGWQGAGGGTHTFGWQTMGT